MFHGREQEILSVETQLPAFGQIPADGKVAPRSAFRFFVAAIRGVGIAQTESLFKFCSASVWKFFEDVFLFLRRYSGLSDE